MLSQVGLASQACKLLGEEVVLGPFSRTYASVGLRLNTNHAEDVATELSMHYTFRKAGATTLLISRLPHTLRPIPAWHGSTRP